MATLTGQPTTIDATIKVCSVEELERDRVRVPLRRMKPRSTPKP